MENTSTSSKTRISLAVVLILTQPGEENSHLTGRGRIKKRKIGIVFW